MKLAKELSKVATGRTLYILDEPTTGLHFADIEKLLEVLQRLVDAGNTVLVIEHNLDVIKQADWIVDLGPEGGDAGGELIAVGTPEEVAEVEESYTGAFLRELLPPRGRRRLAVARPGAHGRQRTDLARSSSRAAHLDASAVVASCELTLPPLLQERGVSRDRERADDLVDGLDGRESPTLDDCLVSRTNGWRL